jgi:acetoin utilization deacetylase AcuC-like enzyme
MGFCIVNHIAVAAAYLRAGGHRVAIVDWDAHHGNGTQDAFWDDDQVLYLSLHQSPFYPGTGAIEEVGSGAGAGYTVNIPLSAGSGPADYRLVFGEVVMPALEDFSPDWILVSAGYDALRGDPLCDLRLEPATYKWMAHELVRCERPLIGFLEGGYDLDRLARAVRATLEAWTGAGDGSSPAGTASPRAAAVVAAVQAARADARLRYRK